MGNYHGAASETVPDRGGEQQDSPPERFFFVHMLKTAGTAMLMRLQEQFGPGAVYPDASDGDLATVAPQMVTGQLLARWAVRGDDIRLIIGHLPLCTTELLDVPFTTLTALREPVARTLSFLQYHRVLVPADRDTPLEAIYDDPTRFSWLIHNHMTKMLSLTVDEMTDDMLTPVEFTPQRLERAKQNLAGVAAVGTQEQFEGFCAALDARFGWQVYRGGPRYPGAGRPPISESFRRRIAEDNAMDAELYDYACELIATRGFLRD